MNFARYGKEFIRASEVPWVKSFVVEAIWIFVSVLIAEVVSRLTRPVDRS